MGLPITAEHQELAASVRDVLTDRDAPSAAKVAADSADPPVPAFWKDVIQLGWLGLPVGEEHGGQGFGLPELAVVVEELGRVVAPGGFLPTALAITAMVPLARLPMCAAVSTPRARPETTAIFSRPISAAS